MKYKLDSNEKKIEEEASSYKEVSEAKRKKIESIIEKSHNPKT